MGTYIYIWVLKFGGIQNCCGLGVLISLLVFICICIRKLRNFTLWAGTQHVGN